MSLTTSDLATAACCSLKTQLSDGSVLTIQGPRCTAVLKADVTDVENEAGLENLLRILEDLGWQITVLRSTTGAHYRVQATRFGQPQLKNGVPIPYIVEFVGSSDSLAVAAVQAWTQCWSHMQSK